jgi:multidrug efflux pump subunit AcrA (membrane-fusion protein)
METNDRKNPWRLAGIAAITAVIFVAILILGAAAYPRLAGTGVSRQVERPKAHEHGDEAPDAIETASPRNSGGILYATGTIGENPGADLWVMADVFEKDLTQVQIGKSVRVRVTSYPERVFHGKITYVASAIDPETRTAKVRCVVGNASGLLKPEMFATIEIPLGAITAK